MKLKSYLILTKGNLFGCSFVQIIVRPKKDIPYQEMSMEDFIKHPLFMDPNHIPTQEEIDENEFLMAVQAMKYSDTDSPDVQAEEYKKDGTFHFKCKLYKKAILAYSAAINVKPTDKKILVSFELSFPV